MTKPISIVPDAKYPSMFRLQWRDGVLSADFYNRTRAADILANYDDYMDNAKRSVWMEGNQFSRRSATTEKPVDALNETGLTLTSS